MSAAGFIHPTAEVDATATLGDGVFVWNWSKLAADVVIGDGVKIGQAVYVDRGVRIGPRSKIQNGVSVYHGVTLGADVFVGPNATFTNDLYPRAHSQNWTVTETLVGDGASIGANATIVCGTRLGENCMIAAGSVVTRDVLAHALVMGQPARQVGWVNRSGRRIDWTAPGQPPAELLAE